MNWFESYMEIRTAALRPSDLGRSRVFARDYMQLMRELDRGERNLPLLKKMIADVEDAVRFVYWNTVAWGHTPSTPTYPCPKCNPEMDSGALMEFIDPDDPPEEYVDEDDDEDDEQAERNKEYLDYIRSIDPDGVFHCYDCGMNLSFSKLEEMITDPTPTSGSRGVMISDQIDHIYDAWYKADQADTFEKKFPQFERLIEYWHGSGDLAHWFIEGGRATIDKYRSSKLPERNWNEVADYGW